MKKRWWMTGAIAALCLTACGVSQDKLDIVVAEATQQSSEMSVEIASLSAKNNELERELSSLQDEYSLYKESMKAYEGLAAAEAEARKIEAESIAASKAAAESEAEASRVAAEAEAAAAAAAQKEAEERMGYETGITYDQLARTPDEYKGKKVKFSGKVIQVLEGDGTVEIRLAVNSNYDTILYCAYQSSIVSSRVLEDDKITVYGTSNGLLSYKSTMGGTITIPSILIDKIDQ